MLYAIFIHSISYFPDAPFPRLRLFVDMTRLIVREKIFCLLTAGHGQNMSVLSGTVTLVRFYQGRQSTVLTGEQKEVLNLSILLSSDDFLFYFFYQYSSCFECLLLLILNQRFSCVQHPSSIVHLNKESILVSNFRVCLQC